MPNIMRVVVLFAISCSLAVSAEPDRYHDLREDEVADRILTLWYSLSSNTDPLSRQEELDVRKWLRENGSEVLPVLVEVFRREDNIRERKRAMEWFETVEGDKSELVAEVGRSLPRWFEEMSYENPERTFVTSAIRFLSSCGGEREIGILGKLSKSDKTLWAEVAEKELGDLRRRLAKEAREGVRRPQDTRSSPPSGLAGKVSPRTGRSVLEGDDDARGWFHLLWVAASMLLAAAIVRLWMVRRSRR